MQPTVCCTHVQYLMINSGGMFLPSSRIPVNGCISIASGIEKWISMVNISAFGELKQFEPEVKKMS